MFFSSDTRLADSNGFTPESELTIQESYLAQIREFRIEDVIGQNFIILHLQSDVGKSLNHHMCKVLDFDHENPWEGRYHCQILTGENKKKMYKLKLQNLGECAAKALIALPQPVSVDLMEPKDFLIHMIMAYSSYRYRYPDSKIYPHQSQFISPDSEGRVLLLKRYVIHHLGLDDLIVNNEGDLDMERIFERANLSELVDNLQKWDPEFFRGRRAVDCSTYYAKMKELIISSQDGAAALKRWEEKQLQASEKRDRYNNPKKNKRKFCKALEITLHYMISFLHIKPQQKGRKELYIHHKTIEVMEKVDATKPLECGKVVGNNIPSLFQDPYHANKDLHTNFYQKFQLCTQYACYGDQSVNFRRFSFGLSGGSNLPNCFICSEVIGKNDLEVAKLDCHHIFHKKCVNDVWYKEGCKKCPVCKEKHFFEESYKLSDQLLDRFFKFIIHGNCERCTSFNEERKDSFNFDKNV